ncbi:MAG TPA: ribosomal protein S18-alanine N-acetyltransferase [Ktedonobacterales bacterium]|nr:ribosomal protein S18-alanine N-acetyltransferase [Ktedonobacterales bacterium]
MRYVVSRMGAADVPRIAEIEKRAYPTSQWPVSAYHRELQNKWAYYIVVRDLAITAPVESEQTMARRAFPFSIFNSSRTATMDIALASIVGYAGLWLTIDEAHVTTIATDPSARGRGLGELLLVSLIDIAYDIGARWLTLEVRVSNAPAQALYHKYGFSVVSTRPRYYTDNNEDAYIMWTPEITTRSYRAMFAARKETLMQRLSTEE